MERNDFKELSKAKIQDKRNLVISKHPNGTYTMVQQIVVQEGRKQTAIFLKGATHVDNLEGLYNLRDAINEAIQKEEDEKG
ncbi:MAG: hypothetical protein N3B21_19425 [Clostridia bacterium]|nr:hypothetical protein [Clostridia bacterium]